MKFLLAGVIVLCVLFAPAVQASCTVLTPPAANFGQNEPSTALIAGQLNAQSQFVVQCNRTVLLGVLSLDNTSYVVQASSNNFRLSNGRDLIAYQLSSQANFATVIDQVGQGYTNINASLLTLLNGTDVRVPLLLRTLPSNVSSGVYSDQLTLRVTGRYCELQITPLVCVRFAPNVDALIVLNVQLTVDRTCSVSMPAEHNLGTIGFVSELGDVPLNIDVNCTRREVFRMYVDMGDNDQGGERRLAHQGGADFIRYQILLPDTDVQLTPTAPYEGAGIGASVRMTPRVRLLPRETAPHPGTYIDNVRAVVVY